MLFISFDYIAFLLIVLIVFWLLPGKNLLYRCGFLVIANFFYYCWWDWRFGFMLFGLSGIAFGAGILLGKLKDGPLKKRILILTLILIFSSLVFFKYFNFFEESLAGVFSIFGGKIQAVTLKLLLPLGISFYTFQIAGYVLDVYWERSPAEKNPFVFLAFSSFFPVILSGPVERSTNLLKQLRSPSVLKWDNMNAGLKMILWGLFTKMVIADNLATYVDPVFANPTGYNSITLFFTSMLFMIQLYADFMGYSNIAIGSAKLLGFDLLKNFNLPFFSRSFSEFWRRWNMSLTNWLFDYIFNPLNFTLRKIRKAGIVISLMVTFLVSGFWHGAAWTFVIWGLLHGVMLSLEVILDLKKRFWAKITSTVIRSVISFSGIIFVFITVCMIAVFFKASSFVVAGEIFSRIFQFSPGSMYLGSSSWSFFLTMFFILFLFVTEVLQSMKIVSLNFSPTKLPIWVRWPGYAFLIFAIILFGKTDSSFIYFQF